MIDGLISWMIRVFTGVSIHWQRKRLPSMDLPAIYFANHSSHLDFLLIWAVLPKKMRRKTRPVAARDYWNHSVLRRWLARTVFQAALIERTQITRANNPVSELSKILQSKHSLILFPEGTRGDGTGVNSFKSGLYHLANQHPEVELVPVYLNNLNRILPKGEMLPIPLICSVQFGESIKLRQGESKADFLHRARKSTEELSPAT